MTEETKEQKELIFPIIHDKCPVCGSTRRVANEVKKQEAAKGKVHEEANFGLGMYRAAISDPSIPSLSCPIIIAILDVCVDCGAVYSPVVNCTEQGMSLELPGKGEKGQMLPPFGRM